MRHFPHLRSRYFRAVWVLATLAWIMPASGALADPVGMLDAAISVQPLVHAPHCDDSTMMRTAPQPGHAPALPMGGGHCCHGGCHCASACNVVLAVPSPVVAGPWLHSSFALAAQTDPVPAVSAPLLRPPIA